MHTNSKYTGRAMSFPAGLALGGLASILVTLIIASFLALLLAKENLAWENVGYGVLFLLMMSSATGATISSGKIKHRVAMVCTLSGVIYLIILILLALFAFGGELYGVGVTGVVVMGSSLCVALIRLKKGQGRGKHVKRRSSR